MSRRDIHKEIISDLLEESGFDHATQVIDLDRLTDSLIGHFESVAESDINAHIGGAIMAKITQSELDEMRKWQRKAVVIVRDTFAMSGIKMTADEAFERIKNARL